MDEIPPLSGLFLVRFDQRVGYTLTWSKAIPGLDLSGAEFKSLPSGLHNVKEDLVYFLQTPFHAGLSAFRNDESDAADRNATFACVGACTPLNGSRLGRVWLHAPELRRLAADFHSGADSHAALDAYWETHKLKEDEHAKVAEESTRGTKSQRRRGLSESVPALQELTPSFHPAHALPDLLEQFGPLLFPLYRVALLRKRCLIIRRPPVRLSCDFIYILSILSSVPSSVHSTITPNAPTRSKPKFSVGITDIDELSPPAPGSRAASSDDDELRQRAEETAYLATTTDELLALKPQLFDYKIEFSKETPRNSPCWPTVTAAQDKTRLKATQKDWRRWRALMRGIKRLRKTAVGNEEEEEEEEEEPYRDDVAAENDTEPLLHNTEEDEHEEKKPSDPAHVESLPWAAIAYDSFVWWASAGERSLDALEETRDFSALLAPYRPDPNTGPSSTDCPSRPASRSKARPGSSAGGIEELELCIVGYFHRWTIQMINVLDELIGEAEAEDESEGENIVRIRKEELSRMGLDGWSEVDRAFVGELAGVYFGVKVEVGGGRIECCGVRVL